MPKMERRIGCSRSGRKLITEPSAKGSTALLRRRLATLASGIGRERIRQSLPAFIDTGFTTLHHVVEYSDGGSLKAFRGTVTMTPDDITKPVVRIRDDALFSWMTKTQARSVGGLERSVPSTMQTQEQLQEHELGNLLPYWRHERGKSQLDFSLDTGISQRRLSLVESGRSTHSRDLPLNLSGKLDIPLRERNVLLVASGYAPSVKNPPGRFRRWPRLQRPLIDCCSNRNRTRGLCWTATGWLPRMKRRRPSSAPLLILRRTAAQPARPHV